MWAPCYLGADRIQAALERLQPGTRALLAVRATRPQRPPDRRVLRVEPEEVAAPARARGARRLAGELGVDPDDELGARLAELLGGEPLPQAEDEQPAERRRRPWLAVAAVSFWRRHRRCHRAHERRRQEEEPSSPTDVDTGPRGRPHPSPGAAKATASARLATTGFTCGLRGCHLQRPLRRLALQLDRRRRADHQRRQRTFSVTASFPPTRNASASWTSRGAERRQPQSQRPSLLRFRRTGENGS